jgi:hypothetical protein
VNRWPIRTGALVAVLSATAAAWAQPGGAPHGSGMMLSGQWYGMLFGLIMIILLVAAIVVLAVVVLRWLGRAPQGPSAPVIGIVTAVLLGLLLAPRYPSALIALAVAILAGRSLRSTIRSHGAGAKTVQRINTELADEASAS